MALIECKECGKQISSTATVCPNCGCATENGQKRQEEVGRATKYIVLYVLAIVLAVIAIIIWSGASEYDKARFYHGKDIAGNVATAIIMLGTAIVLFIAGCISQKRENNSVSYFTGRKMDMSQM